MKLPRLLPLIAIAIGGVFAVNALAGAGSLPELMSATRAFAEDVVAPKTPAKGADKAKTAAKPDEKADEKAIQLAASAVPVDRILTGPPVVKPQTQVCAPSAGDLAKEAGLSSAELQVLQSLGARRGQIEALEKNVDVQQQLLVTAEAKVDAKIATMRSLIASMQALLGQADEKQKVENARLVKIYEGMKPKDAAAALSIMKDEVRLDIVASMKERSLSSVLNAMTPVAAKDLTEKLAQRYATSAPVKAAQAALATPAAPSAASAAAPAPKTAAQPAAAPAAKTAAPPAAAPAPKTAAAPAPTQTAAATPVPAPKAPAPKAKAPAPKAAASPPSPYARVPQEPAAAPATPAAPPLPPGPVAQPAAQPAAKTG